MTRSSCSNIAGLVAALFLVPALALAQITVGTVTGRVVDQSGAVVVGAQVRLLSETQGTRTAAVLTNTTGDYVIPNLAPDTYTVEISAQAFKIIRRTGIVVTGGDHVGVPPLTLEVGATTEQVNVEAQAVLVQTQSAERSTAIESNRLMNCRLHTGTSRMWCPLLRASRPAATRPAARGWADNPRTTS